MSEQLHEFDTVIIGGGIAGLWLANRLNSAGYNLLLLEQTGLGDQQSLASQGMIHGGMKYALAGALTGASEAIADMPAHWADCLQGKGDVDLRGARVLSEHFYMWASQSVTARLTTFFASKALRGRIDALAPADYPPLLKAAGRKFDIYKLVDLVLDVPSVVQTLADQVRERGNQALLEQSQCNEPEMQLRPLQQVMVKHSLGYQFYGHCLGADKTPRLTISSHPAADGDLIWYLGGSLAEQGVHQSSETLIASAQRELAELMPWLDFTGAQWATLPIERAEPRQRNFARPEEAFAAPAHAVSGAATNIYVGWPTKLTLAPNMANSMLALLKDDAITPSHTHSRTDFLPAAPMARTPWDSAFCPLPSNGTTT